MTVKILNAAQKDAIVKARKMGHTLSGLGAYFNVSPDTISRVLKEFEAASKVTNTEVLVSGVRVIKFINAEDLVSSIEKAIDDEVQFSIDLTNASFNGVEAAKTLVYDRYLKTRCDSVEETILDQVDDELYEIVNNDATTRDLLKVVFGEDKGFNFDAVPSIPLSPVQQGEEAYAQAIKSAPKVEVKAPEPIWNASSKFISITIGRDVYNADKDHPAFKQAHQLLVDGDILGAVDLINVEQAVTRFVDGDIRIEDGQLFFKDIELKTGLTDRIIGLMYEGKDFKFLLPFLHNLLENPSRKAVYRLFDFLEANDIEITKEGYFIAWKKVRSDFHDVYTGTMDNSPGKEVRVERNQVDEDDEVTCSHGLHVCSKSYLGHFGSWGGRGHDKVVSVLVHPKDVVSIPVDYNNAKMRTAGYKVIEEVTTRFN